MEALRSYLDQFALTFIPLFVALDAVGNLPIVLGLIERLQPAERGRVIRQAMVTGLGIGLLFVAVGNAVFLLLGIKDYDFLIAGGIVILVLATSEVVLGEKKSAETQGGGMIGVVPIGTPLLVGPAVLTTLLILIQRYAMVVVLASFLLNLAISWLIFHQSVRISAFLGPGGMKAVAKVFGLLLAAIAVKMIREGIIGILGVMS
ncbi:MAG: MarC family protein [Chloroflexi bacterium]|nr:MarC family protein [Chloroflexota bacterium]